MKSEGVKKGLHKVHKHEDTNREGDEDEEAYDQLKELRVKNLLQSKSLIQVKA
jgi:hypothetical protein